VFTQAAVATAIVVGLVVLALSIYQGKPWVSYRTIYATLPQTGNLLTHDPVRIGGVGVGQVSGISIDSAGDARLRLQINPGTRLPVGTTFMVRANGLLGSRFVQLIPGTQGGQLADGSNLRGNANSLTYGVPDALNVFDVQTRGSLGKMVNGLGTGLLGRGPGLNDTIREISTQSAAAQELVSAVVGPGRLGALVPSLQSLMSPLNTARGQIAALLAPAAQGLQPLVDQRTAVQGALDQAPTALDAAQGGLANGERLLTAADALSVQAHDVLPLAPPGLRATTALLAGSHPALIRARGLLRAAEPTVPALLRGTAGRSPLRSPLSQTLTRSIPIFNQVGPYGCNIQNFGAVIRSMTGYGGLSTVPGGAGGPAMAFRLEVIPGPPTEMFGTKDFTGLVRRTTTYPPCHYLASTYPTFTNPLQGLKGQS
jgi:phospholipid/cholesterol/gamma-HCH transport system substrate-binding protein